MAEEPQEPSGDQASSQAASMRVSPRSGVAPPVHSRWKPGKSANPGGMPKRKPVSKPLAKLLRCKLGPERAREILTDPNSTYGEAIAARMVLAAIEGDYQTLKVLLDRIEGPVKQEFEHSGGGLRVVIQGDDDPEPEAASGE